MRPRHAFTLMEIVIVVMIIGILTLLALPIFGQLKARAQRIQCTGNLRNLYVAAAHYVQDNNEWPQISMDSEDGSGSSFAAEWIAALSPYGVTNKSWICPTIENLLGNPDYISPGSERVDYIAMSFDDKPMTPYQWPRSPWFVENADVHGHGNLIIFTDGSISDLKTVAGK